MLLGGVLALYVERGGRTILPYVDDEGALAAAAKALAEAMHAGALGSCPSSAPTAHRFTSRTWWVPDAAAARWPPGALEAEEVVAVAQPASLAFHPFQAMTFRTRCGFFRGG